MLKGTDADVLGARITWDWGHALRRLEIRFPPHIAFLLVGGINAILLTFLTPPFQVHDEFQHFFRSYQLSEAEIWGSVQDGHPGSVIPSSLPEFVERSWGCLEVWHVPPLGTHRLAETWREFQQPLAPSRRQFAEFITVDYSPILYVPQTLGIAAGRLFGASPLALLVFGASCECQHQDRRHRLVAQSAADGPSDGARRRSIAHGTVRIRIRGSRRHDHHLGVSAHRHFLAGELA